MSIPKEPLKEFIKVHKEDYGIELTEEEAALRFEKMKNLLKAIILGIKDRGSK